MPTDLQFRKNTLFVNKKPLNFDYEVGNAFAYGDKIIFLLKIPYDDKTLRNIYCLNSDCGFLWQVQSVIEAYPEFDEELPFEGMSLKKNGNVSAYDFFGRNFEINSNNGNILDFKVVR